MKVWLEAIRVLPLPSISVVGDASWAVNARCGCEEVKGGNSARKRQHRRGWICDRGRFDYTDANDPARLRTPTVGGIKATWTNALAALTDGIKGKGSKLSISLPEALTNEEGFLFRRLLEGPLRGAKVKMHGRTALPAPTGEQL